MVSEKQTHNKEEGQDGQLDELSEKGGEKLEFFGVRHTLAILGFLGFSSVYAMRINLSIAIVAMVNSTQQVYDNGSDSCPYPDDYDPDDGYDSGEFDWDEKTQGLVLGAFYYGYALTNILGGIASERWGGRLVYGFGIILTGLMTMLSPMAARSSSGLFIAIRILEGCAEGVTFPAINTLIAKWYPVKEKSKFATTIFAGVQFGTVVTLSTSGYLCASDFLGGWPSVFYLFGASGVIWGAFWFLLVAEEPSQHPRISKAELEYITRGCPSTKDRPAVPWIPILKSKYFWTILIMHFGNNWGLYTLLTELPTYLDKIQHISIKNNGVLSSLPYLGAWLFSIPFSLVTGKLIERGTLSALATRRLGMAIGGYGPMLGLAAMCFVNCNSSLALAALIMGGTCIGSTYAGYMCSHTDIAPKFAGTLMGMTNSFATIPGFVSPAVTGALTQDNQTLWAWRIVFIISCIIYGISVTIYLVFITTDIQPWNYGVEEKQKDDKPSSRKQSDTQSKGKSGN